jgi:hypothetical protein
MSTIKVALVAVAKSEDYYLDEWLDYNYKLGFDKIIMYQNDWRTDIERPFLEKREWDGKVIQLPVYNSFLNINTEYDWVAFIDCDEFIVLKKHNSIKEFINDYKDRTQVIGLNWVMYGSLGILNRTSNSLLKTFTKRNNNTDQHIKVIVDCKSNSTMTLPHNTDKLSMDTNGHKFSGPFNPNGPMDVAYINHYHSKTKEDWILRCERGRADCNLRSTQEQWDLNVNNDNDIVDMSAYNFMYDN